MSPVPPARRREVLSLLAATSGGAGATDLPSTGELCGAEGPPLDGLLMAERDEELVGAAVFVVQPGDVAFVWPPAAGEECVAEALAEELCRRLDAAGCRLGQCLLEDGSCEAPLMERHGFARLTALVYLERSLDDSLPRSRDDLLRGIEFDPSHNRARFAALLESTYEGTLDCPELNGCRTADEALDGHRAAGRFDPQLWKLYQQGGRDAGLILMADHPALDAREVVYMGVAPGFRGRGVGRAMLTQALREAQTAGRDVVLLGVDVRNTPARRLYEQLGFHVGCRREIHLRRGPECR